VIKKGMMSKNASSYITVRNSDIGKGVFAASVIPAGTVLFKIKGKHLSFEETIALEENESYCLQVGLKEYIALHYPVFLINHSCNPNCGINLLLEFITLREILKDEELRWDYSTSMLERYWQMECRCGEQNCREMVSDFDFLPKATQKKYLKMGIVLPFIVEWLKGRS
jgi:uncharacterized protein